MVRNDKRSIFIFILLCNKSPKMTDKPPKNCNSHKSYIIIIKLLLQYSWRNYINQGSHLGDRGGGISPQKFEK